MYPQEGNNPDLPIHNTDTTLNKEAEDGAGTRMSKSSNNQKEGIKTLLFADMDTIMTECPTTTSTTTEFQSGAGHVLALDSANGLPAAFLKKRKSEEFKVLADRTMEEMLKKKPRLENGEEKSIGKGKGPAIASPNRSIAVLKDRMSFMLPNVTWDEQAKKESNFVGDAYYYDLEYEEVQEKMAGTYVVVYSRPLNIEGKPCGTMETYTPNFLKNYIQVFFAASATASYWAVGSLNFNNRQLTFMINEDYTDSIKADVTMIKAPSADEGAVSSMLDAILELGPREGVSSVSFGIKWMRNAQDNDGQDIYLGFYFVALEIATFNFDSGEESKQLVIGVKVPHESQPDVPSAFLLNQQVTFPRDMSYLKHVRRYPSPTINLGHLQRNGKREGTAQVQKTSWKERAEASVHASSSKKKEEPSVGDDVQMK